MEIYELSYKISQRGSAEEWVYEHDEYNGTWKMREISSWLGLRNITPEPSGHPCLGKTCLKDAAMVGQSRRDENDIDGGLRQLDGFTELGYLGSHFWNDLGRPGFVH